MISRVKIHTDEHQWITDHYYVCAFDVGSKNLGCLFEKRYISGKIETVFMYLVDIRGDVEFNLNNYLDSIFDDLNKCHIILIEKQLHKLSREMVEIESQIKTYISIKMKDVSPYVELYIVDSHLKGDTLGCPKNVDLKVWAVEETKRQLTLQDQKKKIREFTRLREPKHCGDCKVTIEAFFKYVFPETKLFHELAPKSFFDVLPKKEKKKKQKFNPHKRNWYKSKKV